MRKLSTHHAEQILDRCGLQSPDAPGELWDRILQAVCLAYRLGLDAEITQVVHAKEVPNENHQGTKTGTS
ncbi:MAG: hypothetical protein WC736_15715 [Gallionella sp.]|jgi:hypothetical protein